ncbi:unnamed protein product [Fusarium graminearum]|uniref:Uncharacterized protein n=1 Tax=Gibberella zeae TaxID=5518 RepID=A0A4E9DLN2_GIBZA|nr:unnamed protein product [Fusarium graminearum]CAG1961703.1 unnamed protein product [Fusarium graminearum]CAG1992138.1 unnamed protein product [Fusarium graminearum]
MNSSLRESRSDDHGLLPFHSVKKLDERMKDTGKETALHIATSRVVFEEILFESILPTNSFYFILEEAKEGGVVAPFAKILRPIRAVL